MAGKDLIMWVGYIHYPTIQNFTDEARDLGISKRISKVPTDYTPDETRLFFIHDEGIKGDAVIFGYCTVGDIEVVVDSPDNIPDWIDGPVTPIIIDDVRMEAQRGCGFRDHLGAIYLRSHRNGNADPDDLPTAKLNICGDLTLIDPPLDYNLIFDEDAKRFRSFKRVDGDDLLKQNSHKLIPTERAVNTLDESIREIKAGTKWSDGEREALIGLIEKIGPYRACKEMARQTSRTFQSCMYQYRNNILEREEDDVGELIEL